ncbi:MAG: VWA domain-containing protein [Planctomycetia bacterium]|nr:VWA domain-containing protein [Planctomycetia bacterium]
MTFDRPLFLWAFLALAPVVAAFLVKRRRTRVVVPDLEAWLSAAAGKRVPAGWRQFREAGSLALNLAACAALALAAAGPRPSAPQGTDWALVFDVSASMGASDGRWDRSVRGAQEFARGLPRSDRFRVYLAGAVPRALGGWREGGEELPGLPRPDERSGDVAGALALAKEDPAARAGAVKTVVWSDREAGGDMAPRVAQAKENVAIEGLDARRRWNSPMVDVVVRVTNHGRGRAAPIVVAGFGANLEPDYRLLEGLDPGETVLLDLERNSRDGGILQVSVGEDSLALDDDAFAVVPPLRRALVFVVAPEAKSPFLSSALAALGDALDRDSGLVEPGREEPADLLVFDRCAPSAGPCLAIAPPSSAAAVENPAVTAWAADLPLLRGLDLSRLRVARARPLAREPGATVLVDSAAGPLAVASPDRVVLGFALEDSNLPLLAAFPLFVRNCVEELSRERPMAPAVTGEWVTPFEGEYEAWEGGFTETRTGPWRATRPGHAIFTKGGISRPLAVNFFDPAESALADPPAGRELPSPAKPPPPPWAALAALAALLLAADWGFVARR